MQAKHLLVFVVLLFQSQMFFGQEKWSLQKCISYAKENSIEAKQAYINVEQSKLANTQSKLNMLPSLNFQGSHGYNWGQAIDPFTNQFATKQVRTNSLGISSSITLFNGFQNVNSAKSAKYSYLASVEDSKRSINNLSLNVANTYLQVLFGKEFVTIAKNQVEMSQIQRDRIAKQVEVGQLAKSNLLDAESQLARDESALVSRENDLSLALLNLKQLMQLDASENVDIVELDLNTVKVNMLQDKASTIYEIASETMPEIKSAEYRLESAKMSRNVANGSRSPRLTLTGSYGTGYSGNNRQPIGDPTIVPQEFGYTASGETVFVPNVEYNEGFQTKSFENQVKDNLNQSLTLSLTIPLFNGYSSTTNYKREKLNYELSQLSLKQEKNTLRQTIQTSYNDALAAYRQYLASEKALNAQQESFTYTQLRYEQNISNQVEFSNAKLLLANSAAELSRSKYDFIFKVKVLEFYKGNELSLSNE